MNDLRYQFRNPVGDYVKRFDFWCPCGIYNPFTVWPEVSTIPYLGERDQFHRLRWPVNHWVACECGLHCELLVIRRMCDNLPSAAVLLNVIGDEDLRNDWQP